MAQKLLTRNQDVGAATAAASVTVKRSDDCSIMKHKTTQALYAYWNDMRNGRFAPRRFEIEPARIAELLPETFVLERLDAETYRFRLSGTRISDDFGHDFRGQNFLDGWMEEDRITLVRQLGSIASQGSVGVLEIEASSPGRRSTHFEVLLLPLLHNRDSVDRFLGSIAALDPPSWLGAERLDRKRLVSHTMIWPDGRPHQMIDKMHRQSPFLPHVRNARIVRIDRRQFRVYDGGLSKPADEEL